MDDLLQIIRDAKGCKWITGRPPHGDDSCVRLNQGDLEMIERALAGSVDERAEEAAQGQGESC
jgi:hypothetical protein